MKWSCMWNSKRQIRLVWKLSLLLVKKPFYRNYLCILLCPIYRSLYFRNLHHIIRINRSFYYQLTIMVDLLTLNTKQGWHEEHLKCLNLRRTKNPDCTISMSAINLFCSSAVHNMTIPKPENKPPTSYIHITVTLCMVGPESVFLVLRRPPLHEAWGLSMIDKEL